MTSKDRVLEFIEYKGISKREFYLKTGLSNGYLDKTKGIGSDALEKIISAYPEVDLMYIVTGNGKILIDTPADKMDEPVINYDKVKIPPSNKEHGVHATVHPTVHPTQKRNVPAVVTIDSLGRNNIALVNVRARAGYLRGYGDPEYIEKLPVYSLPGLNDRTYRAFEVEGVSMVPTLSNRDIIFAEWVECLDDIREDRVHILITKNDGIIIKRLLNRVSQYGYVIAKSDAYNQRNEYPNLQVSPEDIQEIWYARLRLSAEFKSPSEVYQRINNIEADLEEIKRVMAIKGQLNGM